MDSLDRRSFLRIGPAGLVGMAIAGHAQGQQLGSETAAGDVRRMILLWLDGGPATIDMWDPKPDAPDNVRGEFKTTQTSLTGVHICEHLPRTAEILSRCTLIRSLYHNIPEHGPGSGLMLSGHLPSPAVEYPSLGAVAAMMSEGRPPVPRHVAFNGPNAATAGYLGAAWNAFELNAVANQLPAGLSLGPDTDLEQFAIRVELRDRLDRQFDQFNHDVTASSLGRFYADAAEVLTQDSIRTALDLSYEDDAVREQYGSRSLFGQNALKARRLIEAGSRFVTVGLSGWDTHSNNFTELRNTLLPQLDSGMSALIMDLENRGLLDSTIVCCCGEFGRTPHINGGAGRDHWSRVFSALVAGGGFQSDLVFGETDKLGREPTSDGCTPSDFSATLLHALGINPRATVTTPSGRPLQILDSGRIIHALLA